MKKKIVKPGQALLEIRVDPARRVAMYMPCTWSAKNEPMFVFSLK